MLTKKYKYLFRLIFVTLLGLTIPFLISMTFFLRKSYEEVRRKDMEYYEGITNAFLSQFEQTVSELKGYASNLAADSRKPDSIFYNGKSLFEENVYWYYEALVELGEKYSYSDVGSCNIYYYSMDSVLTSINKNTREQYARNYFLRKGYSSQEVQEEDILVEIDRIKGFFTLNDGEKMKSIFLGRLLSKNGSGSMLLGYQTVIGRYLEPVMIFFELDADTIAEEQMRDYVDGVCFYLLDNETDEVLLDICSGESVIHSASDGESLREVLQDSILYEKVSADLGMTCIMVITEESSHSRVEDFYFDIRRLMLVLTIFLIICCVVALYIEYKPFYNFMKELEEREEDEFTFIRNIISEREAKIEEQKILITDLFINHLLFGKHISKRRLKYLGVDTEGKNYCAYLLDDQILLTSEAEKLAKIVSEKYSVCLYVTDIVEENQTVIIAFLNCDAKLVEQEIQVWLKSCFGSCASLISGDVVECLDEIKSSYRVCMEKKQKKDSENQVVPIQVQKSIKREKQKKLTEDILQYMELHYRDPNLSQSIVAEQFHISNYTLSRIFKNQVGVGYTDYINAKRLDYAKELLLTTELSIKEIAVMVGFVNENYFSRVFRAMVGVSAKDFRE